jgi:hypothetical protein
MMKLIVAFHNFVYAPRNGHFMILQTLLLETSAFHFWVVLEDARLFLSPVIMLFTEGWDFLLMLLKCLCKFLFCSVLFFIYFIFFYFFFIFYKQNAVLVNYL